MTSNMEYTKDDLSKDLVEASGSKHRNCNLDENFIVVGEKLLPPHDTNCEIPVDLVQFIGASHKDKITTPDIKGITAMLNVVKQHNIHNNEIMANNYLESLNGLSISKFNLNVEALKPKYSNSSNLSRDKVNNVSPNYQGINYLTGKLKNKIKFNNKEDTPQNRREKNMALLSLLKLHTAVPTEDYSQNVYKLKSSSGNVSIDNDSTKNVTNMQAVEDIQNLEITSIEETIKESINKVNNWLNNVKPQRPRTPSIYLSPVTFKIKEKKNKNTVNEICNDTEDKICTSMPKQYVPSSHANELYNKYVQQSKSKDNKILDIWTKLELQLKTKDEELKNKHMQNGSTPPAKDGKSI